jgi:hypothetical protein
MKLQSPLRDLPREVSVLVVASFFVAVGFGIIVPAIPLFARSFGVSFEAHAGEGAAEAEGAEAVTGAGLSEGTVRRDETRVERDES